MQVEIQDMDKEKDLAKNRPVTLDDGSVVYIRQKDPYGYWSIHYKKGRPPQVISGSYTSFELAFNALKSYLSLAALPKKVAKVEKGFGIQTTDELHVILES